MISFGAKTVLAGFDSNTSNLFDILNVAFTKKRKQLRLKYTDPQSQLIAEKKERSFTTNRIQRNTIGNSNSRYSAKNE